MKMWSQGLGKNELVVDFKNYQVIEEFNQSTDMKETIIRGVTQEPVQWEFLIRLNRDDLSGVLNIFFKPATLFFVARNINRLIYFFIDRLLNKEKYAEKVKQ